MRGFRFRRQQPIDRYIVDFYCRQAQLVLEIDGSIHHSKEAAEYDDQRTQFLNELGLTVIRFSNEQVIYETRRSFEHDRGTLAQREVIECQHPPILMGGPRGVDRGRTS